jgi:hypothetical protein
MFLRSSIVRDASVRSVGSRREEVGGVCVVGAALILTTNLPFSEWTQVIPNARLCKAVLDRITDRAHIIETGDESYRFRRTIEKRQKKG